MADDRVVGHLRSFGPLLPIQVLKARRRKTGIGSQNDINERLGKLMKLGFVERRVAPLGDGTKRPPYYWQPKGWNQSLTTVRHTLLANDILLELLSQGTPKKYLTERELYGSRIRPAFDGWVDFGTLTIGIELDTGSLEAPDVFKQKILRLRRFREEEYPRLFETKWLDVLFITTAGERRRDQLVNWAKQALEHFSKENRRGFAFANVVPFETSGHALLNEPIWRTTTEDGLKVLGAP